MMIREILMTLYAPFAMLFGEKPTDHPETASLIRKLQAYNGIDSIEIIEIPFRELKRIDDSDVQAPDKLLRVDKSKNEIQKLSRMITKALIYPPDDILLCTDVVGYMVIYQKTHLDTIVIDDGAKFLRHKINGAEHFAHYEGNLWGQLRGNNVASGCVNDGENQRNGGN
jgi:hypothetical protein